MTAARMPKHAARPLSFLYWGVGLVGVLTGVASLIGQSFLAGGALTALGLGAISIGHWLGQRITAVQLTNTAVQHLTRGNIEETEALLAQIPASSTRRGVVARAVALLRATIALYDGRAADAVALSTMAIEGHIGLMMRSFEAAQRAAGYAMRAVAHAALGDSARAEEDALRAEASPEASPAVLARARIAHAVVLSRAGDQERLAAYLTASSRLVLEHAMPRERALFRALRRSARSQRRSVYREAAKPGEADAPSSKLASWIAQVAPDAASHVAGDLMLAERTEEMQIPSAVPSDIEALRKARNAGAGGGTRVALRRRTLALWAALVVMLLAIWQFLTPAPRDTRGIGAPPSPPAIEPAPSLLASSIVTLAPIVLVMVLFVALIARQGSVQRRLAWATRQAALGHRAFAKAALQELVKHGNGMIAASAGLELARLASAETQFAEAISRCDAAIARVHGQPLRAAASDLLLPALMTESAVATAARGGSEEADAELAMLSRDFPTYAHLAASQLRVRLVRAVREADPATALSIARARTAEMPLPFREDVLADLVLAAGSVASDDDRTRLEGELRDDVELAAWIEAVAPGLAERALSTRAPRTRIADPAPPGADARDDDREEAPTSTRPAARHSGKAPP